MKRLGSSDSLGALISMCPPSDEQSPRNNIYNNEYQSMLLEGLVDEEETGHMPEKKRRLSVEQVKALERNFEVENKLEPERKVNLAKQLGLQPRQVAVWFQNRRARWKTKQLERDYDVLKDKFNSLKHNFESLQHDNDALLKEIKELKSKLNSETNNTCIKGEALLFKSEDTNTKPIEPITPPESLSHESEGTKLLKVKKIIFSDHKDGQSDSDSSAILNEDNSPNTSNSSTTCSVFPNYQQDFLMSPNRNQSPPSIDCFGFCDLRSDGLDASENNINNVYNPSFVKIEEHNFFSGEEPCNFFSEEQAPSLHWYCSDQWT